MGSLLRATGLTGYDELVTELGGDPLALREAFFIAPGVEHRPDTFVAYRSAALLVEHTAAVLACPDFGLRLSRAQGLDVLGPVAVIARNAESVLAALESIGRYLHVHSPALHLSRPARGPDSDVPFAVAIKEPGLPDLPQAYELTIANGTRILRLLGGPTAAPSSVSFRHRALSPPQTYASALGCAPRFGQPTCGFTISQELAAREIDDADVETRRLAAAYLDRHVVPSSGELSDRVLELIRRLLPLGEASVETVAERLAVHPRTLQRQLVEQGTAYRALLDRERREQVRRFLAEPDLSMGQVAGLLGYAEQSALTRAVRRWFGSSPKQVREQILGGRGFAVAGPVSNRRRA